MAQWWDWNPTSGVSLNPLSWAYSPNIYNEGKNAGILGSPGDDQERDRKKLLYEQAQKAGGFADQGEGGFAQLGSDARQRMDYLREVAGGKQSIAGEQLRQGLQQNQAAQRSMAASASPTNSVMAARTAMMNNARMGSGMSGQAALAGMQERRDAEAALAAMINQQRQMELQAALGSRQTATTGYGAGNAGAPEKGFLDKYGQMIVGGFAAGAKSDRRAKKNIEDADAEAKTKLEALKAYVFDYKDEKDGKGRQFGIMAQDLERAGLKHAVIDTPDGKMVHGAKLATSNTAMLAALARRVSKIEGGK